MWQYWNHNNLFYSNKYGGFVKTEAKIWTFFTSPNFFLFMGPFFSPYNGFLNWGRGDGGIRDINNKYQRTYLTFIKDWTISSPVLGVGCCGLTLVSLVSEPSLVSPRARLLIDVYIFSDIFSVPAIHPIFNHTFLYDGSEFKPASLKVIIIPFLHA